MAALTSAFPDLWPHRIAIALVLLVVIILVNLRGLQEAGTLMAVPVYLFLASYLSISDNVTAVYIELEPGAGENARAEWESWWPDIPMVVVPSPYRSTVAPLLKFLDETDEQHHDGQLATVVLPEFIPGRWWQSLLHNQTAWLIKASLLYNIAASMDWSVW